VDKRNTQVEPIFPHALMQLFESLRQSSAGEVIYSHIKTFIEKNEAAQMELQQSYINLLNTLLNSLATQLPAESPLRVQLQLISLHLTPPLSKFELETLRNCLELYKDQLNEQTFDLQPLHEAITSIEAELKQPIKTQSTQTPETPEALETTPSTPSQHQVSALPTKTYIKHERRHVERRRFQRSTQGEISVDSFYRRHLNEKKESLQKLQSTFSHQVSDTIRQHEDFGMLLSAELSTLKNTQSAQDLEILRNTLMGQIDRLQTRHQSLTNRLVDTQKYLQIMEADSRQLNDELTRVHQLSLTDELTDLPNRRAFMRRLEDEMGRVQRYGNSLPVVIIDIDHFKTINDQYGHSMGDNVLTTYASHVLSIFRHHDMVARYGGEEFAIVLPNTDLDGAIRAVAKVQRRAAECTFTHNGQPLPAPTFSAGIALHLEGESPTDIIKRADNALYRAKKLGRNRIELAVDEQTSDQTQQQQQD